MISEWQFLVTDTGGEWAARGVRGDVVVLGFGSTPITALMVAEAKARRVERRRAKR